MEDNMTVTDGEEFTIATLTETEDSKFCIDEEEFQFAWHFNKNSSSWYVFLHLSSYFVPDSIIVYISLTHAVTLIVEDVADIFCGVADIFYGIFDIFFGVAGKTYKSLEPLEALWRLHLDFNDHEQWAWSSD